MCSSDLDACAATVILASGGYPGNYEKGKEIRGAVPYAPSASRVPHAPDVPHDASSIVFHCGTKMNGEKLVTDGGRVLSVTGLGATLREAVDAAYARVGAISFDGMFYRRDIAHRAFDRGE